MGSIDGQIPPLATLDVLAEIVTYSRGRSLGHLAGVPKALAASIIACENAGRTDWVREDLIQLAAHCVARVEQIDRDA